MPKNWKSCKVIDYSHVEGIANVNSFKLSLKKGSVCGLEPTKEDLLFLYLFTGVPVRKRKCGKLPENWLSVEVLT